MRPAKPQSPGSRGRPIGRRRALGLAAAVLLGAAGARRAGGAEVPAAGSDLVGRNRLHTVIDPEEVLVDVAVAYRVGYVELVAANPEVDPWLPGVGTELVVPGEHILPDAPRRGIVMNLAELRLYHFAADGAVASMPIGIGSEGVETPLGDTTVVNKRKNPTWWPPPSIRAERPELPASIPPGPDNPLGDFALDLGWPLYRIHGTNRPYGVGRRVSHGCIRMYAEDIEALFAAVRVGTPVRVVDQPVKVGWQDGRLYLEVHPTQGEIDEMEAGRPLEDRPPEDPRERIRAALLAAGGGVLVNWPLVDRIARERRGVPALISFGEPWRYAE